MSDDVLSAPTPVKPRMVNHVPWWTYVVLAPVSLVLRVWLMSLRISCEEDELRAVHAQRGPVVMCMWHNRLVISAELRRRFRSYKRIHGLVSASKDGAWLVAFFNLMGVHAVRGSSSWRGGVATVELGAKLKDGDDVLITPDGPRGPCYDFKKGPAMLALRQRVPVLLVGADFSRAKSLDSWDRLKLPAPFSRVKLRTEIVMPEPRWDTLTPEVFAHELRTRLLALTGGVEEDLAKARAR